MDRETSVPPSREGVLTPGHVIPSMPVRGRSDQDKGVSAGISGSGTKSRRQSSGWDAVGREASTMGPGLGSHASVYLDHLLQNVVTSTTESLLPSGQGVPHPC